MGTCTVRHCIFLGVFKCVFLTQGLLVALGFYRFISSEFLLVNDWLINQNHLSHEGRDDPMMIHSQEFFETYYVEISHVITEKMQTRIALVSRHIYSDYIRYTLRCLEMWLSMNPWSPWEL